MEATTSKEDDLERLAREEIMKEAKRGAERAKDFGAYGWVKPPRSSTNKKFLGNVLVSTLRSYSRKHSHQHGEQSHSRKYSRRYEEKRNNQRHLVNRERVPKLINGGHFRFDDYKKLPPCDNKYDGPSSSRDLNEKRWDISHDKHDIRHKYDISHNKHDIRHKKYDNRYDKHVISYDEHEPRCYDSDSKSRKCRTEYTNSFKSESKAAKYRTSQRLDSQDSDSGQESSSDWGKKKNNKKSKKREKNEDYYGKRRKENSMYKEKKPSKLSSQTEDCDSLQGSEAKYKKSRLSCESEESLLADIQKHSDLVDNPREEILDIFGEYVIDKSQKKKKKHKKHKSKHKKDGSPTIILDL